MAQMMQMGSLMISQMIMLFIGALCYRWGIITDNNRPAFTSILLNVMMPAMIFQSFKAVDSNLLKTGVQALIASLIIYSILTYLGAWFYRDQPSDRRRLLHYATLINNVGLAGQPLATSMYGSVGTLLASIYLIPHRIFMWTVGVNILSGEKQKNDGVFKKLMTNPNVAAVFLGLLWGLTPWQMPEIIDRPLTLLGQSVSALAALTIGSILATIDFNEIFEPGVLRFTFIRLIVIPLVVLTGAKLLAIDPVLTGVLTIMASMPAGTATALLATQYGLDDQYASKLILVSTIGCSVTVPIFLAFI